MPPCPQPSLAKLSWRHRVFCLLGHCQGFLCPVRVRKYRANPHPQDLREDRGPLQARAHRPHRQVLTPAVVEGVRGVRRLKNGRFRAACGRDAPGVARRRPFSCCCRRGIPHDLRKSRFRAACGRGVSRGCLETTGFVLLQARHPPGPRNRLFSRSCGWGQPSGTYENGRSRVVTRERGLGSCEKGQKSA